MERQRPEVSDPLTPRERTVLRSWFGLDDGKQHRVPQIGQEIGKSERTVRRIKQSGLSKLRGIKRSTMISDFLDREFKQGGMDY